MRSPHYHPNQEDKMADRYKVSPEELENWKAWVATRPPKVQKVAKKYPPWKLFAMPTEIGLHRVYVRSYGEDGTVTVNVTGEYNRVLFGRTVFGIDPTTLTECNLPPPGEDVGDTAQEAGYDEKDIRRILIPKIKKNLQERNQIIRPGEQN